MKPGVKPQEVIPALLGSANAMLPGMQHARALLDVSIRVLEYFAHHAEKDTTNGAATTFEKPSPELREEVENIRAMLSAFARLH